MAHEEAANAQASTKPVIRKIGLLLSGEIDKPILDADTVAAVNGETTPMGRETEAAEVFKSPQQQMPSRMCYHQRE